MPHKKITAPKKTTIKGQPHQLAYINDAEQGLLMALGGAGKPVNGIPAYYDEGDDYSSPNATDADTGANLGTTAGDDSGADFGNKDAASAIAQANEVVKAQLALADSLSRERAEKAAAGQAMMNTARNPLTGSVLTAQDFNFNTMPTAQRIAQSYVNSLGADGTNIFAPSVFSGQRVGGSIGNFFKGGGLNSLFGTPLYSNYFDDPSINKAIGQAATDQLQSSGRIENAKDNYGVPSFAGAAAGAVGGYNLQNIQEKIAAGGRPVFDDSGQLQGVFHKGLFGMEVYSGNPVEGVQGTGFDDQGTNDQPEIKEPNPLTGQCEAGYIFDEDLNACRLDTGSGAASGGGNGSGSQEGLFYKKGLLDDAPQFMPAGMNFDEMNANFRLPAAYNPDNFENQMNTTGFSILK